MRGVDCRAFIAAQITTAVFFALAVGRALLAFGAESPRVWRSPGLNFPDSTSE